MTKEIHIQSIFQMILKLLEQKDMEIDEAFTEGVEFDAQNHEDKRFALAERDRVLIDKGYTKGLREGIGFGYDKGYDIGKIAHQTNRTASYDAGWEEGCEEGYEEGHDAGWCEGYDRGHANGEEERLELADALSKAEENDYEEGHDAGWQAGFPDADDPLKMYRCVDEAFDGGVQKGWDKGFDQGYDQGYSNACLAISTFALSKAEENDDEE